MKYYFMKKMKLIFYRNDINYTIAKITGNHIKKDDRM